MMALSCTIETQNNRSVWKKRILCLFENARGTISQVGYRFPYGIGLLARRKRLTPQPLSKVSWDHY